MPPEERSLPHGIRFSLIAYGASRLVVLVLAKAAGSFWPDSGNVGQVLSRWDGGWYAMIAVRGYANSVPPGTGQSAKTDIAFFPLYPLLMRGLSAVTGMPAKETGILISLLAGAGAAVAFWALARRLSDVRTADRAVVLFCFFPSAYILSMVYAEALFFLFVALCLLALLDDRWLLAGLSAAAASATRPMGFALTLCCLWASFWAIKDRGQWRSLIAPILAPLGGLAYFVYLWAHTGMADAFFETQTRGWYTKISLGRLLDLWSDLWSGDFKTVALGVIPAVAGSALAVYLLVRWRPPAVISIYVGAIIASILFSSSLTSVPRFLLAAFPALVAVALYVKRENTYAILVASSAMFMAALFVLIAAPIWFYP